LGGKPTFAEAIMDGIPEAAVTEFFTGSARLLQPFPLATRGWTFRRPSEFTDLPAIAYRLGRRSTAKAYWRFTHFLYRSGVRTVSRFFTG